MTAVVITLCILLLIAYVFDVTAGKTRIPSVILLLALGWGARQGVNYQHYSIPNLNPILPILGTIGLILIVLEGALELEFNRSKMPVVRKSFVVALLPMPLLAFGLAFVMQYVGGGTLQNNLLNVVPLCVISSAVAIPSVKTQTAGVREFITYESSFSDILGVLFFNFMAVNEVVNAMAVGHFVLELLIIFVVSVIGTALLSLLLSRIEHPIRFMPIILLVILIYYLSKLYHLPGLLFILIFGLVLGNLDELRHVRFMQRFNLDVLDRESHRFKEITTEATFLIRALFFLLFGFLIENAELLNVSTLGWAVGIAVAIVALRALVLLLAKLPLLPFVFVAPRGLITILLFLAIEPGKSVGLVNKSLIIQVMVFMALFMMLGLMRKQPPQAADTGNNS